jgi:hypothetical protein
VAAGPRAPADGGVDCSVWRRSDAKGAVVDRLESFTGMRGFRSRGQLEAWVAGVGSPTVRPASGAQWKSGDALLVILWRERAHVWA